MGNFIVHQYRIETILLQLFARQENSEGFSIISVVIFEINIAAKQKQAQLVTIFCLYIIFHGHFSCPCRLLRKSDWSDPWPSDNALIVFPENTERQRSALKPT